MTTNSNESRRPLRGKPRERNFRFSEYSKPQSKTPKDDRTLSRKGPQVEIVRPKWHGSAPMTFRPLPMTCAEDPSLFDPTRLSTDEFDFSDFWRGLPAVKYVGIDQKFTFLAYNPRRLHDENYNPRTDNPYHVLYNAIMDAVKKTGEAIVNGRDVMTGKWAPLISDGPQKAFQAPTKIYFLQGALYESDGELYVKKNSPPKGLRDGDLPQIIEISKSAGDKLAKKLNMLNPAYQGDTDIEYQNEMYLYGDIVDLTNGSFITLFNPDKHNNIVDAFEDFDEAESNDSGFQSWGVAINPDFSYVAQRQQQVVSGDLSQYADTVRSRVVDWDSLLYFPPDEEICLWMAQAFRSMPALLHFGWADNPAFFTDEVNGVLANRVQVSAGGGSDESGDNYEDDVPLVSPRRTRPAPQKSAALSRASQQAAEDAAGYGDNGYGNDGYGTDSYDSDSAPMVTVDEDDTELPDLGDDMLSDELADVDADMPDSDELEDNDTDTAGDNTRDKKANTVSNSGASSSRVLPNRQQSASTQRSVDDAGSATGRQRSSSSASEKTSVVSKTTGGTKAAATASAQQLLKQKPPVAGSRVGPSGPPPARTTAKPAGKQLK